MSHNQSATTVSSSAAQDLVETCKALGVLSEDDLRNLGLNKPDMSDVSSRIPETVLISLWQTIARHDRGRGIGLNIGTTINPEAKGLLASWISQSKNLREALTIFRKNILLMNSSESWEVRENKQSVALEFTLQKDRGYPDIAIERSMSAMVAWAQALSGCTLSIRRAEFSFPAPSYAERFHAFFGHDVRFSSTSNQLVLDAKILDLPVLSSNPFLKSMIQQKASQTLAELQKKVPIQDKVKGMIREAITSGSAISASGISEILAVSRQTLYRQLKQENTDFQSLHDAVRKEEALKMLKAGMSTSTISLSLGYKETSSFYKAFNRWFMISPKAYLKGINEESS